MSDVSITPISDRPARRSRAIPRADIQPELLTVEQVNVLVQLGEHQRASLPDFPKPLKLGHRTVRYRRASVLEWIDRREAAASDDTAAR